MSTTLNFGRDAQGLNAYAPPFSTNKYSATMTNADTATVTVPSTSENWIVVFGYTAGSTIWVANNATAAPPVGATFASTTSELNPGARTVKAADVISLYNDGSSTDVGVYLYAVS